LGKRKIAKDGDKVKFTRMGLTLIGEVQQVRESSVIVRINDEDAKSLRLDTPLTVISHKNYEIID